MHDAWITGPKLPRLDVPLRRDWDPDDEVSIHVVAAGTQRVRTIHRQHEIWLPKAPVRTPLGNRRERRRIALDRSLRHPLLQQLDLRIAQTAFAHELAGSRLGLPRRHVVAARSRDDGLRATFHIRVAQEVD